MNHFKKYLLVTLMAAESFAAGPQFTCNIDYWSSADNNGQLQSGTEAKECVVQVQWGSASGNTVRTRSCTVASGQTQCHIDLSDSSVPSGWQPYTATVDPIKTAHDAVIGCVYSLTYPQVNISTFRGIRTVTVLHRYDCTKLRH